VARSALGCYGGGTETIKIFSRLQEFCVSNLCVHCVTTNYKRYNRANVKKKKKDI